MTESHNLMLISKHAHISFACQASNRQSFCKLTYLLADNGAEANIVICSYLVVCMYVLAFENIPVFLQLGLWRRHVLQTVWAVWWIHLANQASWTTSWKQNESVHLSTHTHKHTTHTHTHTLYTPTSHCMSLQSARTLKYISHKNSKYALD